jgi:hypothetical protein
MMRNFCNVYLLLLIAAAAVAQPNITGLSSSTAARSSRVLIQGSGFGAAQGSGHIDIGGLVAPLTRWSDTLIAAYIPETAPMGSLKVQVFDSHGFSSNTVPVDVTLRSSQGAHVRWRFQADADYIQARPAVAPDGTVYALDVYGHVYAVAPDGALKWIFNASGTGFGNISIGPDGTIYFGNTAAIFALAPNGSLKWQFSQNPGANTLYGPNVGPDGNIYAVGLQGLGVFSVSPQGTLRWSTPEDIIPRLRVFFQEIVFGPPGRPQLYFHGNSHLRSVGLDGTSLFSYADNLGSVQADAQPAVAPDGSVYTNLFISTGPGLVLGKFDNAGNRQWVTFDQFPTSTNALTMTETGPDGVVYDGRNLMSLDAINPDSTVRWQYTDTGILFSHMVSPLNDLLFVGGVVNYGQPGFFEAVSTAGTSLWKVVLPVENGLNVVPMSRARFTSDGQTTYIGTSIPGQSANGYSYLYSVQTGSGGAGVSLSLLTMNPSVVKGGIPSQGTVTLSGPAPAGGLVVTLASNRGAATVPPSITIPAGAASATFTVKTKVVAMRKVVTISATYSGVTKTAKLTLTP